MIGAFDHANGVSLACGEIQGDVATVVDVGPIELRCSGHGGEDSFGDSARDGGHGRDETTIAIWGYRASHDASNGAAGRKRILGHAGAQEGQLGAQFIEDGDEALRGSFVGAMNLGEIGSIGVDDQVDGAIAQMKTAAVW